MLNVYKACTISLVSSDQLIEYKPKFNEMGKYRLVANSNTSIPSTHFINGKYVFFIEHKVTQGGKCSPEYTAIGVSKAGEHFTTERIKNSRSYFVNREILDYECFAPMLEPYDRVS